MELKISNSNGCNVVINKQSTSYDFIFSKDIKKSIIWIQSKFIVK